MIVENITLEDHGAYTLIASNEIGEVKEQVNLKVLVEKPTFTKVPSMQNIKDHQDIDLLVAATGVPKPTLKWYCNDVEMNDQFYQAHGKFSIENISADEVTQKLHVKDFSTSDICNVSKLAILTIFYFIIFFPLQQFKVVASNMGGNSEITFGVNIEQVKPSITKMFDRFAEIPQGQPLELTCKIDGSPFPEVEWFKDSEKLQPNNQ